MVEKTQTTTRSANAEIKDPPSKTNPDVDVEKKETTKTTEVEKHPDTVKESETTKTVKE